MGRSETVRCFWHGSPLGPYQLLGMRSFVDRGHTVELFTYDRAIAVPEWIVRRDANDIWPTDHVLSYQNDDSQGSFSLHANLFRYAMLYRLGGWWIDLDVILLRQELPAREIFFAVESVDPMRATNSVLKFPAGHPAMSDCVARCVAAGETPLYGETAVVLFTEIVTKCGLAGHDTSTDMTYPLSARDVPAMFDPVERDRLHTRCQDATFVHLFHDKWRRAGISNNLGPPAGSFIDDLLRGSGCEAPAKRMEIEAVRLLRSF
jgi:Glycosyltransferase sugar-binding region containing DXD motif